MDAYPTPECVELCTFRLPKGLWHDWWDKLRYNILTNDIHASVINWQCMFFNIIEECVPTKTLLKRRNLLWLTKNIMTSICKRNYLHKKAWCLGDDVFHEKYRKMRNKVTLQLRNAKKKKSILKSWTLETERNFGNLSNTLRRNQFSYLCYV